MQLLLLAGVAMSKISVLLRTPAGLCYESWQCNRFDHCSRAN